MSALRFCMVTTFYPPYNFGGDGIFVQRLSRELADRGHHVEVVHCTDAYRALAPKGPEPIVADDPKVDVHRLASPLRFLSIARRVKDLLEPYAEIPQEPQPGQLPE